MPLGLDEEQRDLAWYQDDPLSATSRFVLRLMVAGFVLLLVALVVVGAVGRNIIKQDEARHDVNFAAIVALAPADSRASLILADEREGVLWEPGLAPIGIATQDRINSSDLRLWRSQVRNEAIASPRRHFMSEDPTGTVWWHAAAPTIDGQTLVVSRRQSDALAGVAELNRLLALTGLVLAAALGALWYLLHRHLTRPLQALMTAGEDLRLRGEIRPATKRAIDIADARLVETDELARILDEIETETLRGSTMTESLLVASNALGESLDLSTVLARTLEHLQRLLTVDRSVILTLDKRTGTFRVTASLGHTDAYLKDMQTKVADPMLPSHRSLAEHRPIQFPDTEATIVPPSLTERARRHNYRSVVAVPLGADLEHPAVLLLHDSVTRVYSYDEIELCKSFASIATAAIRNAELFSSIDEDLQQQTSRIESIVESVEHGILLESSAGELLFANSRMRSLLPVQHPLHNLNRSYDSGGESRSLVQAIAGRCDEPELITEKLDALRSDTDSWVDIEIPSDNGTQHLRARAFDCINAQGQSVGRGQVWLDITTERELEVMKEGLLAAISHEFRTPLALIKGYATTLLADDVEWGAVEQHEFLSLVNNEADRLTALVQRLLDMRRIQAGMLSLQLLPTDIEQLVESTLASMPHLRHRIVVGNIPAVEVPVDSARIVTVLRNLLENAATYSPDDQPVELLFAHDDNELRAEIRDYGRGISEKNQDRIFNTFYRGSTALDAEFGGIGLGLSIARGFVHAHGGQLAVTTPDDGVGSIFWFTIPVSTNPRVGSDAAGG